MISILGEGSVTYLIPELSRFKIFIATEVFVRCLIPELTVDIYAWSRFHKISDSCDFCRYLYMEKVL